MADGKITIAVVSEDKDIDQLVDKLKGIQPQAEKSSTGIKEIATSLGLVKIASAAFNVLKNSMGAAISRFDTFNSFPKTMDALGFSTEKSDEAISRLSDGIDGLPTKLDDVVSTTKRMASVTGDLDKSTDATIALNNAMLASGSSTADASRGMDQYIQMLSTGKVDMMSWRTLQETMPIGLQKTAEAMGFVGESAQNDLYAALKSGDKTFKEFQDAMIELGTGTGELAELAKVNSEGIATSFSNLANTASKGLANILTSLDNAIKEATGKNIAQQLDGLKVIFNGAFEAIGAIVEGSVPIIKLFAKTLGVTYDAAKLLSPVLYGLGAAYVSLKVINSINGYLKAQKDLIELARASTASLTLVTEAQTAAIVAKGTADKADTASQLAKNGALKVSTLATGVLTGAITAQEAITVVATAATTALGTALKVMTGPIGWVVAGIGAVVGVTAAVIKHFNKASEETDKLREDQSKLVESNNELNDSVSNNIRTREGDLKAIDSSQQAYKRLAEETAELASQEELSGAKKNQLKENVDQLNESVEGLNLSYNEETGALSASNEQLQARIDAQMEQEKANAAQQNLLDIMKEQNSVQSELEYINKLREEWAEKVDKGSESMMENAKIKRDARDANAELDEQEKLLIETSEKLGFQEEDTRTKIEQSSQAAAEATQLAGETIISVHDRMNETQSAVVGEMTDRYQTLTDSATSMFDTLSDKSETSVAEMTANMEENQRVIGDWATNIEALAKRGIDDGLLNTLREAGPESAGQVAAMVNASDEELSKMSEVYAKGGKSATDAMAKSLNMGGSDIEKEVLELAKKPKQTLMDHIKEADFKALGANVSTGTAKGIKDSSNLVDEATAEMGDNSKKTMAKVIDSHSPSKEFMKFGNYISEGLAIGIKDSKDKVMQALNDIGTALNQGMTKSVEQMRAISNRIPMEFNGLPNQMMSVGSNIMIGLANGINSNAGYAYSAARNVANNIKDVIQSAMDIHSPSRWMKDFVGKNMMVGWGDGIDAYSKEPIQAINDSINKAKNGFSMLGKDLTTGSLAFGGSGYSNSETKTNNEYNIHINVDEWSGEDDINKTLEDMTTEIERQNARLE